jgi:cytochrome P450
MNAPEQDTDAASVFADHTRISDPAGARRFRVVLDIIGRAAALLPLAPGVIRRGDVYYILGHDDALAALANDSMFATPYKKAMISLDTFRQVSLLGFGHTEDAQYQKNLCQVMQSMPLEMAGKMGVSADRMSRAALDAKKSRIDFMADLVIPVTLRVTQEHYGVRFGERIDGELSGSEMAFFRWTMAILEYVFGPPGQADYQRRAAVAAGTLMDAKLRPQIDAAAPDDATILGRMRGLNMDVERIQPTLAALLVGTLPTITQGAYNIMQVLLARPAAMAMARDAALQEDDDDLRACLHEALRFRPVLPAIFRTCVVPPASLRKPDVAADHLLGPVDWLGRHIPSGATAGIVCVTANFDPRAIKSPRRFDPSRPASDSLSFGQGKHWCTGVPFAMEVLVNMFKPLLQAGTPHAHKRAATKYFMDFFAQSFQITIERDEP